ncbi:MAG: polyprenyl synthetase family protein [Bradymonadia bacterium]
MNSALNPEGSKAPANSVSVDPVMGALSTAAGRHGVDPLAHRLLELGAWLGDDLLDLDQALDAFIPMDGGAVDLSQKAAGHLVAQKGKRIRPLCVMLSARIGGRTFDPAIRDLAVASELVHAATLLHDDVIDEGDERRGHATARVVFGNSASILGGDYLLIEALKLVRRAGAPVLLGRLLDTISQMVEAEAYQLERRHRFDPSRDLYYKVIEGKTAALFRWGLAAGGTMAGLAEGEVQALSEVGMALGTAFQLVDDILDLDGDPTVTGKAALADLREGKMTWPLIISVERDAALREQLSTWMTEKGADFDPAEASMVVSRMKAAGAIEATREEASRQADVAREKLSGLPEGRARAAIEAVVEATVSRFR